ncbi:glycosyltransferase family 4 protein [Roseiarcaceae bacterium H3SJ34-1]|uniref:glycosyltransferase family 4 protein n=1 Tax=Terripilifer ovatus TaxID=3032367 RepID=UPI003AB995B1|nr:glycosyltransferase family 4 protein [Roseiarcaceae bacterium H3SJ34-1]
MTIVETSSKGRLLIVTPVGVEGQGGIDRLLVYFLDWVRANNIPLTMDHVGARGEWKGPWWVLHFLGAIARFTWLLLTRKYALVHIHVSTDGSALRKVVLGKIAKLFGTPYIIHFHGMVSAEAIRNNPPWLRALGVLARDAARVIVLGEAFRGPFRDVLGVADERIAVIHNGVPDIRDDAAVPHLRAEALSLLFCGEVGDRKGVDLLIAALAQMQAQQSSWDCTIAGNGSMEPYREAMAQSGIADHVKVTGWLSLPEVHKLMRAADVVVLPSRAEALPLSLIEGAAAGNALVATDVGAVRDVVNDDVNGIVVRHDASDIAAALRRLIADQAVLARMQVASRALYERQFTVPVFARNILDIYRSFGLL